MVYIIILLITENKGLFLVPIVAMGIILVCWLWYSPLKYIIENRSFYIISGWRKSKVYPISDFTIVKKSRTILASPARGLKRLEIETKRGDWIIISPKEREEFIKTIKTINPGIKTPDLS